MDRIDAYEAAEEVAVVYTHDDLPQGAALDGLADHDAHHGLAGALVAILAGCVGRPLAVQGLGDVAMDQVDQFRMSCQDRVDPVILAVVLRDTSTDEPTGIRVACPRLRGHVRRNRRSAPWTLPEGPAIHH